MNKINIYINNKLYTFSNNITILQACSLVNIEIPRFCYYEKLSIAGNCRACLVQVEGSPKLVASCAMPIQDNMKIHTNNNIVKKARENILEMLLINHPLDCPICDQGGECDLQDLALIFGKDIGRFNENKHAIVDYEIGTKIKTHMTRCIYCTRCVRFGEEFIGIPYLGTIGRGVNTEISNYINSISDSEIVGNIIDLCPVGALTSKPSAYTNRSWELKKLNSIDIFDSIGSNIEVYIKNNTVIKVLPKINENINEEWITDKIRFSFDGFNTNRLSNPLYRKNKNSKFTKISWKKAFEILKNKLINNNILGLLGSYVNVESSLLFKNLILSLSLNNNIKTNINYNLNSNLRKNYIYNDCFNNFKNNDLVILIGLNLKVDSPILNIKLIEAINKYNIKVIKIGNYTNNLKNNNINQINLNIDSLLNILEGRNSLVQTISKAKNVNIIINDYLLDTNYNNIINYFINNINLYNNNIKVNILSSNANNVTYLDMFNSKTNINSNILYLLNYDNTLNKKELNKFIIYQGHHGDINSNVANLIIPNYLFLEQNNIYINTQGISQKSNKVLNNTLNAKSDIDIFIALFKYLNINSNINNNDDLINLINNYNPSWIDYNNKNINKFNYTLNKNYFIKLKYNNIKLFLNKYSYNAISNYYLTDPITKSSKIMRDCSI